MTLVSFAGVTVTPRAQLFQITGYGERILVQESANTLKLSTTALGEFHAGFFGPGVDVIQNLHQYNVGLFANERTTMLT